MLTELQINNVAIIDSVTIEFGSGFNVLTGETGAGKSILIDSINMALGGRTRRDIVRSGTDFAFVQAVFEVGKEAEEALGEFDIEPEDGLLIFSRRITADGKSTCRINGRIMPLSVVREAGALLLTIHGQLDNQSLLVPSKHLGFVDGFAANAKERGDYKLCYNKYKELKRKFEELKASESDKERRAEMLAYSRDEIKNACLKAGEEEELNARFDFLENSEKIMTGVYEAHSALYGDDEGGSAFDLLSNAENALGESVQYDERLKPYYDTISSVLADIDDVTHELKLYIDGAEFEPGEIDGVQERLSFISGLKRKYSCGSVADIIAYGEKCDAELLMIENLDAELEALQNEINDALKELERAADILTKTRADAGKRLSESIMLELNDLDMKRAEFSVRIEKGEYTPSGWDDLEFLISTNPGEEPKPLAKIASGGEMSRIMLAIKSILSKNDIVDTLIFDEIDTGVSGRAAQKISEKICAISRDKQVLCITHLAQIASMGDRQYLIQKSSDESSTSTDVRLLSPDERCRELARIIGGVSVTDTTVLAAREMLSQAVKLKQSFK